MLAPAPSEGGDLTADGVRLRVVDVEQPADGFVAVDAADAFAEQRGDVEHGHAAIGQLRAALGTLLVVMSSTISDSRSRSMAMSVSTAWVTAA